MTSSPPNAFFELHAGLPQQGPGSDATTARAFRSVARHLPTRPRILDMGCGTGRQTLVLADLAAEAVIEAIDPLPLFLEELLRRAGAAGFADRISTRAASMLDASFGIDPVDLIWSEGAIYNVGLGPGLRAWRDFVLPGGCVALTELSWLVDSPPIEALDFWNAGYPAMKSVSDNLQLIQDVGWRVLDHFTIPVSDWQAYYEPQSLRHRQLSEKYAEDPDALAMLGDHRAEMDLYQRYSSAYGYVFYVLRRSAAS